MGPGMRSTRLRLTGALTAGALLLGGCEVPGASRSGDIETVGVETTVRADGTWIIVEQGKVAATPTPVPAPRVSTTPAHLPSPLPEDTTCAFNWLAGQVLIPLAVRPGASSLAVSWPRVGEPPPDEFRVAAVPQTIVDGRQPEVAWKTVSATSGCSASTTITGLTSGEPYIVWLDAPEAGHQIDGTPRPRSGRSTVVYPR